VRTNRALRDRNNHLTTLRRRRDDRVWTGRSSVSCLWRELVAPRCGDRPGRPGDPSDFPVEIDVGRPPADRPL